MDTSALFEYADRLYEATQPLLTATSALFEYTDRLYEATQPLLTATPTLYEYADRLYEATQPLFAATKNYPDWTACAPISYPGLDTARMRQ